MNPDRKKAAISSNLPSLLHPRRITYLLLVLLGLAPLTSAAQSDHIDTRGRDFWLGFMQNASGTQQLSLKIASATATSGTVEVPLAGWSTTFSVPANSVTTVVVPNIYEASGSETALDRGVHVTAADPVTVAALNYQNQTTDASQILPVGSLGTAYRVEALPGTSTSFPDGTYIFRSEFMLVATQDGTVVTITPTTTTTGGHAPNVPFTVTLNAGQTYPVLALTGTSDLTGTLIEGTAESGPCRTFAVFGGSMCAVVGCAACDHVNEQMAPIGTWGTNFHTIPFAASAVYGYRVQAGEDDTWFTLDGGSPIHLDAGQVHEVLNASQPVCIAADKPVSVTQIMEGATCAGTGDPSLLVLDPDDRTSTSTVFTTFPSTQATINHYVNILTPTASVGQLLLDGAPITPALFGTYAACGGLSYAKVPVAQGTHTLASPAGFIGYAYGLATGESYLYDISNEMTPAVVQDSVICSSSPITLTAPIALDNAQWTAASAPTVVLATGMSFSFTPDHNDTYRVDGELPISGCLKHFEYHVGLPVDPQLNLLANGAPSATVCQFSEVQLEVSPFLDPQWFDVNWSPSSQLSDPGITDPVAYPNADTWYKLEVTSPVGCGSAVDSVLVSVQPSTIYAMHATTGDDSICAGNNTGLRAQVEHVISTDAFEGGLSPLWEQVLSGSLSNACGSVAGTALYFNGPGTRSAATVPMDLSEGGMAHFALKIASGSAPCDDAEPGDDVVLEYSLDGTSWTLLSTYNENAFPGFTQVDAAIPPLGPAGTTVHLRWRQLANSGAGQDNWSMDNVVITRLEDAGASFTWSPTGSLANPSSANTQASPNAGTWYTATVATPSGCSYVDSVQVHVAPAFSILPMNDTTRCGVAGTQLHAAANSGSGIAWSWTPDDGSLSSTTSADPVATPSTTTAYTVGAVNSIGCTASAQVQVAVSSLSAVQANASDATLCHGETVDLSAAISSGGPYTVSWSPSADLDDPAAASTMAAPEDTSTFTCTVMDTQSGCFLSDAVTVNVNPAYTVQVPNDTTVCTALGLQLHMQHNMVQPFQISWSPAANLNAANIANPTILVDTSTTYVVTMTDNNGCTASDSTTVNVAFDNLITPVNMSACQGETLQLDAGFTGSTYTWSTGEDTQSIAVNASGTYTATITNTQECQAIKTFYVTFNPLPALDLGPDLALCGEPSHVIEAGGTGNSVQWSTGATGPQLTVNTTGTYGATITTPQGCTSSDSVYISLNPLPSDELQDVTSCIDAPPTLDAGNPGCSYAWSNAASTQAISATSSATYSVTVTTPQHCSATFDAVVDLMPEVHTDLGADTTLCAGQPLALDPGAGAGTNLLWNTGSADPVLNVTASGLYSVQASNGYCTDADSISVVFNALPVDPLANDTACTGASIIFNAGNAGAQYAWSTGSQAQSITVTTAGQYTVAITGGNGCAATFSANAVFVPPPTVGLGPDTVLCKGQALALDAGNPGISYLWNTGAATQMLDVTEGGTYSVTVDNGHCTASDEMQAMFNPVPSPLATHDYFTCLDEEPHQVLIDAGNPGSTFHWGNGESAQVIQADAYGWQVVTVTNAFGCSLTDSAMVHEFCRPTLFIPNAFTPNGDGRNDVWLATGNNVAAFDLYVFDRWGGVVFHSTDVHKGWDGTVNGTPAPNDMYAWRLTYRLMESSDGSVGYELTKLGHVQVLR